MTNPDYRALCAELEAVGPSASDVTELFYRHMGEGSEVGFENAIAEALARWVRPAAAPVPEPGEVGELVEWLLLIAGSDNSYSHARLTRAATLLQQLSAPAPIVAPVPVSERWPEFSDCDDAERVWCWSCGFETWRLSRINQSIHTHWLPAHAIPVPQTGGGSRE